MRTNFADSRDKFRERTLSRFIVSCSVYRDISARVIVTTIHSRPYAPLAGILSEESVPNLISQ